MTSFRIDEMANVNDDAYKLDINNFKIVKSFKSQFGSYGKMFLVEDSKGNEFAAKEIIKINDEKYDEMVNNEISALINCQCQTIIKFYGFSQVNFKKERQCTIFTEFGVHGTLMQYLEDNINNMEDNTIRQKIIIGVIHGLKEMHSKNFIHLDIKPENIVLDENFEPKIIDFGTALYLRDNNSIENFLGSPLYMAPEIFRELKCNKKADIYSFGILLYTIVTRSRPYEELQISESQPLLKKVDQGVRPRFKNHIKKWIKELIMQCWDDDPSKRPNADEIYLKLAKNIEGPIQHFYSSEEEGDKNESKYKYFLNGVDVNIIHKYVQKLELIVENCIEITKISKSYDNIRKNKNSEQKNDCIYRQYEELINQIQRLKTELEKSKKEKNALTQTNINLQDQISQIKAQNQRLQLTNVNKTNAIKQLKKEVESLVELNKKIEKCSRYLRNDNYEIKELNACIQKKDDALCKEKEKLEQKINELTKRLQEKEKAFVDEKEMLKQANKLIETQNNDLMKINSELSKMDDHNKKEIKELQKLFDENQLYKKALVNQQRKLKEENDQLKRENINLKSKKLLKIRTVENKEDCQPQNEIDDLYNTFFKIGLNSIDAQSQLKFLSSIQRNLQNKSARKYLQNICSLLDYLISFNPITNDPKYIDISLIKINELLNDKKEVLNRILLLSDATELLYHYQSFLIPNFINIMKNFENVIMEIQSTSTSYKNIYNLIASEFRSYEISLHVTGVIETNNAFKDNHRLNYIKIGPTVRKISDYSFHNCDALKSIEFSEKIMDIGNHSFSFCKKLVEIVLPSNVKSIGNRAFYYCISLKKIFIPNSVMTIGKGCFEQCDNLEFVNIPSMLKSIENCTFSGCKSLKKITIPSSVTLIGKFSFENCESLQKINFHSPKNINGNLQIEEKACLNCIGLEDVIFPCHLNSIGPDSFMNCQNLKKLIFQSKLDDIGENSFSNCSFNEIWISKENEKHFKIMNRNNKYLRSPFKNID